MLLAYFYHSLIYSQDVESREIFSNNNFNSKVN